MKKKKKESYIYINPIKVSEFREKKPKKKKESSDLPSIYKGSSKKQLKDRGLIN